MSRPLLKTKLFIPSPVTDLVTRPNLSAQMDVGLDKRLSLIAAPAGFGKTTFVSSWVRGIEHPVAWISLDEADNDPAVFWAYIVAGFQRVISNSSHFGQIATDQLPPTKTILTHLINELAENKGKVILVLDDYHLISNPQIHQDFIFLLDKQPPALHIILLTRADPPLPIAKLRGRGLLTEIRANDLRFTVEETRIFLNEILNLKLSAADIAALDRHTEGWVIGLQLAAISMQEREDKSEFIVAFSGGHHFVLEYLTEEVIARLPNTLRNFLLQTAVLERFNVPLCMQVTQNHESAAHLTQLQHQNLFIVPLDDEKIWFRYHHLFSDLLKNYLQKEFSTEQISQLYHRASQWYQSEDELDEAIRYALLARDFEQAADWIEQIIEQVIARGQIKSLMQWIETLPQAVIHTRPRLLMHQGWVIFLTGNVNLASQVLRQAKAMLASIQDDNERNFLHGRLSAMLATIMALSRDLPAAVREAEEALALLSENEFVFIARALRAKGVSYAFLGDLEPALTDLETAQTFALKGENKFLAAEIYSQIGTVRKHQGKLSLASAAYQQILDFYENPHLAPPACLGYIGLAEIALERDDLETAENHLNAGIELCQKGNIGYALQPAYLIGGLLKLIQGDEQSAQDTIRQGEDLSRRGGGSLESILGLARFQTRFHLLLGECEAAEAWATGKILPPGWDFGELPIVLDEIHQSLLALVHLRNGRFEKALDICNRSMPEAHNGGRMGRVIELSLCKAVALWQMEKTKLAIESMMTCLALAESEGYRRVFLEMGDGIVGLLKEAIAQNVSKDFAAQILSVYSGDDGAVQTQTQEKLIDPLTVREMEVLRLMCEGYSNQKIADVMIVSVNTVKKHTSNIYSKLGVRNRAQAVLQAREIDLV